MRITSLSGRGLLSFDHFTLDLCKRATFVVGPNGAGKSNTGRLLTVTLRALDGADGGAGEVSRQLASFLAARHIGSAMRSLEVRVSVRLTDPAERTLVTEFVKAVTVTAIAGSRHLPDTAALDLWGDREVTEDKLGPLMAGTIVTSHPGTEDGRWRCVYEFAAEGSDKVTHTYEWVLLGDQAGTIVDADVPPAKGSSDVTTRLTGDAAASAKPDITLPEGFQLSDLLPPPGEATAQCTLDLSPRTAASPRRLAEMTGLPLVNAGGSRMVNLATVLRVIFRRALVHTSDLRLLPGGGASWSSADLALVDGAEARLPELLLLLKNGDPAERARYQRIRELFTEFTQGRRCEVRLMRIRQPTQSGQEDGPDQVPAVWVTVSAAAGPAAVVPEVPIEFAGAGAWEALVLASVLAEPSTSVVVLDEPAVALHPSLQRQLGAHLLESRAEVVVITHSAELLPLTDAADVQLVRLDRDDKGATQAWPVDEACRVKMTQKLRATGNERLPFASRAILCEGQDDVEAITELSTRMGIDVRRQNIAVTNCAGRENLPDYMWFCAQLGLKYLAVMDADASKPDALKKAQAVCDALDQCAGGELFEFPENLESTFSVAKVRPSLVPSKIREIPFVEGAPDPQHAASEVVALANAIKRLAP